MADPTFARSMLSITMPETRPPEVLHEIFLTPVYVFGGCCEKWGYGLGDATGVQSDCNRAIGHIFRVDDIERVPDTEQVRIRVLVDDAALALLTERNFDDDA